MRKLYWILSFAAVSAVSAAAILLGYMYVSGSILDDVVSVPAIPLEKIEMGQVSFDNANPKNFQINVKWLDSKRVGGVIVFTSAFFNNGTGDILAFGNLHESELEAGAEMTLDISTDVDLPSGNYTITLVTTGGSAFVSSWFTKPYS
jgi:hypothetical protein